MSGCWEVDKKATKSNKIVWNISKGGSTIHVILGDLESFGPNEFPSAFKDVKDASQSNPCGVYAISHNGKIYNGLTRNGVSRVYSHLSDTKRTFKKDDLAIYIYSSEKLKLSTIMGAEYAMRQHIIKTKGPDVADANVAPSQESYYITERDFIDPNILELVPELIEGHKLYEDIFPKVPVAHAFVEEDDDDYIAANTNKFQDGLNVFTRVRNHSHSKKDSKSVIECTKQGKVILKKGSIVNFREIDDDTDLRAYEKGKINDLQSYLKTLVDEHSILTQDVEYNSYSQAVKACCGCDCKNTDATNAEGTTYLEWRTLV